MADEDSREMGLREKRYLLVQAVRFDPRLQTTIVLVSFFTAFFEGIGLGFLLPIIEAAQSGGGTVQTDNRLAQGFQGAYDFFGLPFNLEFIMLGVALVMALRFTANFFVTWLRDVLEVKYVAALRSRVFDAALDSHVEHLDRRGSEELLNSVITETKNAGNSLRVVVNLANTLLGIAAYLAVAVLISVELTFVGLALLGGVTLLIKFFLESAFTLGGRVVDANERVQGLTQTGVQGIRVVKVFNLKDELATRFDRALDDFVDAEVRLSRNGSIFANYYQYASVLSVFLVIYVALTFFSLSLGPLSVLLFAMYRLAPKVSRFNNQLYNLDSKLPHLANVESLIEELRSHPEPEGGNRPIPDPVETLAFEDVTFRYGSEEEIAVKDISFEVERGESIGFVGESGAGKSTLVSLIARLYTPTEGSITADGIDIEEFPTEEWRSRISIVRQDPFIFNESLRENVTASKREASQEEIERACEAAQVTEFVDDLADGYDTVLGDEGVRLSGGQRQRVALARALLKDADVLVLDEATNELDSKTERRVYEGIRGMDAEYIMVLISHKSSALDDIDEIHTLVDGLVVQSGGHAELLAEGGKYGELYQKR